jgi:hypothetical protein
MRTVALAMFILALLGCGSPARTPADATPTTAPSEDIDVLSESIDCRRSTTGHVEVDAKCCKDNFQAMGC